MFKRMMLVLLGCVIAVVAFATQPNQIVVFQSDFGLKDGAVAAMKGVATGVDKNLHLYDLTHEITPYDIWQGAYRLYQTLEYWPAGTVFVSIVDPGVGTARKSVVLKTRSGHYIVTPDNGTLTLVADKFGIAEVREIDEAVNRRANSQKSYTFHGRDVYAYTAARLAAQHISYTEVGNLLPNQIERIAYQKPQLDGTALLGTIPILDVNYGNVWTNIGRDIAQKIGIDENSNHLPVVVEIYAENKLVLKQRIPFVTSFGEVAEGDNLLYFNSLDNLALAVNMGDFATKYQVASGPNWHVKIYRE